VGAGAGAGLRSSEPDREIVHSHDFNRYLTPFRAEWDPKDGSERLIVVGR
jgi:DNA damage-binding protein 2